MWTQIKEWKKNSKEINKIEESTLFKTGMTVKLFSKAKKKFAFVWAWIPWDASTRSKTPESNMIRLFSLRIKIK